MQGKILRFILLLVLIPLIYAFSYQAILFFQKIQLEDILFFLLGMGAYLLVYVIFLKHKIGFIETLVHELTHAVAALTIFQMPRKLVVDPDLGGGRAGVVETAGCFWVALAPYFLPLVTLPFLLIEPVIPSPFDKAVDFLIGFTLAFHLLRVFKDLRVKQTDITTTGTIFSAAVLIALNLIFLVIILAVVTGNYSGIWDYIKSSLARTVVAYQETYAAITSLELPDVRRFLTRGG